MQATVVNVNTLPAILTVEQLQQVLGISRAKAYELANRANFPALRLGRTIRIPRAELLRWLEEQVATGVTR